MDDVKLMKITGNEKLQNRKESLSCLSYEYNKMKLKKLIVICQHRSEYPNPITFTKGTLLEIGEKYTGDEGWDNWYLCSTNGQEPGWVPEQIIEWIDSSLGKAKDSYTARELDVDPEEILWGMKELNGWIWCTRTSSSEEGWVPLNNIRQIEE